MLGESKAATHALIEREICLARGRAWRFGRRRGLKSHCFARLILATANLRAADAGRVNEGSDDWTPDVHLGMPLHAEHKVATRKLDSLR